MRCVTSTPRVPSGKMNHCPVPTASSASTRWLHTPVGLHSTGWAAEQGGDSSLGHTAQDFSQQEPGCGVNYDASPVSALLTCISLWITSPGAQKVLPTSLSSPLPACPLASSSRLAGTLSCMAQPYGPGTTMAVKHRQIFRGGSATASPS